LKTSPDEEDGGAASADDVPEMAQGECNSFLNEKHNLIISVVGGGTTHEILSYTSTDEGALII